MDPIFKWIFGFLGMMTLLSLYMLITILRRNMTIDKRVEDERKLFKYQSFRWGPCVIKFKIPDEFRLRLLEEAKQSRRGVRHRIHRMSDNTFVIVYADASQTYLSTHSVSGRIVIHGIPFK